MRKPLYLLTGLLACAGLLFAVGYLHQYRQTSARRMAAWREQQAEMAERDDLERLVTLQGGKLGLAEFADLMAARIELPVEIDTPAIEAQKNIPRATALTVRLPKGSLSARSALRLALEPLGLAADAREGQVVITTLAEAIDRDRLMTMIYPLPQPEPAGMDAAAWVGVLSGHVEPGGHLEATPGALVILATDAGHRRIRQTIDAICSLGDAGVQPVALPPPPPGDMEQRIAAALAESTSIGFVETPLEDAVHFLMDRHNIPILLSRKPLADAGVSLDTPVTKNVEGISLRSALRLLLKELDLTFVVKDDALWITTPDEAESRLRTIAYPVHDLVNSAAGVDCRPLEQLVVATIARRSWAAVGGPGDLGGIGDGWLLVSQTEDCQVQVAMLLAQLRLALENRESRGVVRVSGPSQPERKIDAALAQSLPLSFVEMPLQAAVRYIRDKLQVPIVINVKTLADAGINFDTPVTCDLPAGPAAFQLKLLLEPLDLTYVVRDEVVQTTTPDDAEWPQDDTWNFDIRGLTAARMSPERLCQLLTAAVDPSSWDFRGGPASAQAFRGLLLVSQTRDNLAEVERLLAALNQHCVSPATGAGPKLAGIPISANPAHERIAELLAKEISVSLKQTPIREALKILAAEHNLPLVVDIKSLSDAGINLDWPVTVAANDRPAAEVLSLCLQPRELSWMVREHVIYVTLPERIESLTSLRLYWVGDLTAASSRQLAELRQSLLGAMQSGQLSCAERIEPDWLVVRASEPAHDQIQDWLNQRRQQPPAGNTDRGAKR